MSQFETLCSSLPFASISGLVVFFFCMSFNNNQLACPAHSVKDKMTRSAGSFYTMPTRSPRRVKKEMGTNLRYQVQSDG